MLALHSVQNIVMKSKLIWREIEVIKNDIHFNEKARTHPMHKGLQVRGIIFMKASQKNFNIKIYAQARITDLKRKEKALCCFPLQLLLTEVALVQSSASQF